VPQASDRFDTASLQAAKLTELGYRFCMVGDNLLGLYSHLANSDKSCCLMLDNRLQSTMPQIVKRAAPSSIAVDILLL
jgi:hypothetical protein